MVKEWSNFNATTTTNNNNTFGIYHGGGLREHLEYTNGKTIVNDRGA